jgi:acyl-CoA reductase-like NAD-dependent aldehyde dehydrogenase
MTALEEYTAHHAERAEDVMYRWPWRRFEQMFRLHLLRKAREELRELRDLRIAALDANTNYDATENRDVKQKVVEQLREIYQTCVKALYSTEEPRTEHDEMEDDPLFAPIVRRTRELRQEVNQPLAPQAGMGRTLLEAT